MDTETLTKITVGDSEIFVFSEVSDEFQSEMDTLLILLSVLGMKLNINEKNEYFRKTINIRATDEENNSLSCFITFIIKSNVFSMDTVFKLPYSDLIKVRKSLMEDGYGDCFTKRFGGIMISTGFNNLKSQQCMVSLIKKMQSQT